MGKFKFFAEQIFNWLFTTTYGSAAFGAIWGAIMIRLVSISNLYPEYGYLTYGVIFFFVFYTSILFSLMAGWIWTHITQRVSTKKPTFLEYKIESNRFNLSAKSNIYKEPNLNLNLNVIQSQGQEPANRQQRRRQEATQQPSSDQQVMQGFLTAAIIVNFERPIAGSSIHFRLESIVGVCPTPDSHAIDERYAIINLSGIRESSSFRIRFN